LVYDRAKTVAQDLPSKFWLSEVAWELSRTGYETKNTAFLDKAASVARDAGDSALIIRLNAEKLSIQGALTGDNTLLAQAAASAAQIEVGVHRAIALLRTAEAMASVGDKAHAGTLVNQAVAAMPLQRNPRSLGVSAPLNNMFSELGAAAAKTKDSDFLDRTMNAAAGIRDPQDRASSLLEFGVAVGAAGNRRDAYRCFELSAAAARNITDLSSRVSMLQQIAEAEIVSNENRNAQMIINEAVTLAQGLTFPYPPDYPPLCLLYALQGNLRAARHAAEGLTVANAAIADAAILNGWFTAHTR
jgi:hypothetical protein